MSVKQKICNKIKPIIPDEIDIGIAKWSNIPQKVYGCDAKEDSCVIVDGHKYCRTDEN